MSEFAQVSSVEGDKVKLRMFKNEACNHCHACDLGTGGKEVEILAINDCDAEVGDIVELFIKKEKFLNAVIIMYVMPLISLLMGVGLGYLFNYFMNLTSELIPIAFGLLFTLIAFLIVKKLDKDKLEAKYTPMAVKVLNR